MTGMAVGAEYLYSKGHVNVDRDTNIRYAVVPLGIPELYVESEGGTRYQVLVGEDRRVAVKGIGRAGRRHKREYTPYKNPDREDLGTRYELSWAVPHYGSILSEKFIAPDESAHLEVAEKSADYDRPSYGMIEVATGKGALYLTADVDFSVYLSAASEQLKRVT